MQKRSDIETRIISETKRKKLEEDERKRTAKRKRRAAVEKREKKLLSFGDDDNDGDDGDDASAGEDEKKGDEKKSTQLQIAKVCRQPNTVHSLHVRVGVYLIALWSICGVMVPFARTLISVLIA